MTGLTSILEKKEKKERRKPTNKQNKKQKNKKEEEEEATLGNHTHFIIILFCPDSDSTEHNAAVDLPYSQLGKRREGGRVWGCGENE